MRTFPASELYALPRLHSRIERVLDLQHLCDKTGLALQFNGRVPACEHHFKLRGPPVEEGDKVFRLYPAAVDRRHYLVEYEKAVAALQCLLLRGLVRAHDRGQKGLQVGPAFGKNRVAHVRPDEVDPELSKGLLLSGRDALLLEKLYKEHLHALPGRPYGEAYRGGRLSLALSGVDMDQTFTHGISPKSTIRFCFCPPPLTGGGIYSTIHGRGDGCTSV